MDYLAAVAHDDDPTWPRTYANCFGPIDQSQATYGVLLGANIYFGWYTDEFAHTTPWALKHNIALNYIQPVKP